MAKTLRKPIVHKLRRKKNYRIARLNEDHNVKVETKKRLS